MRQPVLPQSSCFLDHIILPSHERGAFFVPARNLFTYPILHREMSLLRLLFGGRNPGGHGTVHRRAVQDASAAAGGISRTYRRHPLPGRGHPQPVGGQTAGSDTGSCFPFPASIPGRRDYAGSKSRSDASAFLRRHHLPGNPWSSAPQRLQPHLLWPAIHRPFPAAIFGPPSQRRRRITSGRAGVCRRI